MAFIGPCHWDGFEDINTICSLVKGAEISYKMGNRILKIYAGNKYNKCYRDFKDVKVSSLEELLRTDPYTKVFNMGFDTIVIVSFIIYNQNDDYWRHHGPVEEEYNQFNSTSKYLHKYFPKTEFILSNWESDWVLQSVNIKTREILANNLVKLINMRNSATSEFSNVKTALEVNRFHENDINATKYIIPKVSCDMISYSCYETLWKSAEELDKGIKYILSFMKTNMELYIGEFGYPLKKMDKTTILKSIRESINIFRVNKIRLAFYWNMYNNERNGDGFNEFGLIDINGNRTYVCDELFKKKDNSTIIIARHAYSLANKWKGENSSNYINTQNAELYNLRDAELCCEGINSIIKSRDMFWLNVKYIAERRQIRIFVSPLKRAIQTCLLSLQSKDISNSLHNIKITVTPFLTETGSSKENHGMVLDALKCYPPLLELKSIVKELNFLYFNQNNIWWETPVEKNIKRFFNYMKQRRYEWNNKECIVCFSHWGFIKHLTQYSLSNFGTGHYFVKNEGDSCYTHQQWVSC